MERFRTVRVRNYVHVHTFQKRKNHCSRFAMSQSTSIKNREFLTIASWGVCFFTVKILMQKLGAHELCNFTLRILRHFYFYCKQEGIFLLFFKRWSDPLIVSCKIISDRPMFLTAHCFWKSFDFEAWIWKFYPWSFLTTCTDVPGRNFDRLLPF
jgi:hypothetical protein